MLFSRSLTNILVIYDSNVKNKQAPIFKNQEPINLNSNKNQNLENKYDTNDKNNQNPFPKTNILIKES